VTIATGATITGESATEISGWRFSSDEWGPGSLDAESAALPFSVIPVYAHGHLEKPLTIRAGQGFTLKNTTNTTAGSFDITVLFTQEDA
jgi:hypothetical protein